MTSRKPYWIRAGKFTLFQRIAMLFFGVLTFYLLVRTLDKEGYGVWMLFVSVTTLVQMAREGFLKKPLIRYINKLDGEEKKKLQSSSLAIGMIFSLGTGILLVVGAGFLARSWESPQLEKLFYLYFITNFSSAIFSHCNNIQEAHFRFNGALVGNLAKSGLFFGCVAYFYFTETPVDTFILGICDLVVSFIAAFVMYLYGRDLMSYKLRINRRWSWKLFSYGKYTLGTNISGMILRNTDMWMLGWYISPAAVAVYNVAIRIANLFEVPTMAMASVLFPQAVKKAEVEGPSALKELYEKSVTIILLMVVPAVIMVIFFSKDIVRLLAGEGYEETAMILNVTMLYGLIIPFNKQMAILLEALGRAKLNMLFVIRNALINVVLNAIFIPNFGVIGAAYATLCTMVIVMIINQIFLKRNFNVELLNLFRYSRYFFVRLKNNLQSKGV